MERCTMPKSTLQICSRAARYRYLSASGATVAAYCAQHDRAGGHSAMLRPRVWEYSRKVDIASGVTVK